ncbi:hypothetical protein Taro_031409 [Colocasia esculenta]|uniref:Uncharacterized protein n=1 Tax=Colocasia esculenta TaxID=4460 RepID=A0A843VRW6_COLES|nr:hypothetical protein [Colocasia esculenta]
MGVKGFVEGGIASIVAGCSTHPLDLIKVRMQLQGEAAPVPVPNAAALRPALAFHGSAGSAAVAAFPHHHVPPPARLGPVGVGMQILRSEGPRALFSGVSATMLRQTLYSTTRMGLYDILKTKWSSPDGGSLPLHRKIAAGLVAGGVGAAVGNPADVAMVRMQADGRLPPAQRRNYRGVGDAIGRMARAEGVGSLWRGSSLTVNRAMIVTASQLATYDQVKEAILESGAMADGLGTHVTASFAAGFVAALASNPVDVVKTRVMNMKVEAGAPPPYAGALDCALKTVRAEGPMALYKGFIPTVSRQGPFTVVLFVTLEQVRKLLPRDFMGVKGFVEGGIASIVAGCSTHPLDLIKVRMQLQGEAAPVPNAAALRPALAFHGSAGSPAVAAFPRHHVPQPARLGPVGVGMQILRSEGPRALFSGVSATMLRQTLYSTTRMGLYDILKTKWSAPDGGSLPLHRKIAAGLVAGGVGAAVGNPADVAMVRMQADGRLPPAQRRNYRGVGDAIGRMARAEGVGSLWRGSSLTVNRAMIVTASQLATYDQVKEAILESGAMADGLGTHVTASFAAGFVAALASNPVDVVKTRVMNMKVEAGAPPPYAGALDCALKTVRAEGPMALYKGFIPTVSRQGPFTVVLFVTLEQVRKLLPRDL